MNEDDDYNIAKPSATHKPLERLCEGKRFMFDFYCGPGIRYRSILTTNKQYDKNTDIIIQAIDLNIPAALNRIDANEENSFLPNLQ